MTLLRDQFLGISRPQLVTRLDGSTETVPSVYLDSAATSLMPIPVLDTMIRYLQDSQANAHSKTSVRGRATTTAMNRARQLLRDLVSGSEDDAVVFCGSGATGPLNLLARTFEDRVVLVSQMEHHSNILPWSNHGRVRFFATHDDGTLDEADFDRALAEHKPDVVAVSAMSNVTGVINPIHEITRRAHAAGAMVVVDASQAAPHIKIEKREIDFIALSGHKLYAPGSPGVLIGRRDFLNAAIPADNVGGGIVVRVDITDGVVFLSEAPEALEAGTQNVPGIVALGAACLFLKELGVDSVHGHDVQLSALLMRELAAIENCVVYGPSQPEDRGGIVAFNLLGIAHGLVAAALNDFFAISVRNDCFCAQPYVRSMLDAACNQRGLCAPISETKRGMVRASFSPFTTENDVHRLATAAHWITVNVDALEALYSSADGVFVHKTFSTPALFDLDRAFYQAL